MHAHLFICLRHLDQHITLVKLVIFSRQYGTSFWLYSMSTPRNFNYRSSHPCILIRHFGQYTETLLGFVIFSKQQVSSFWLHSLSRPRNVNYRSSHTCILIIHFGQYTETLLYLLSSVDSKFHHFG